MNDDNSNVTGPLSQMPGADQSQAPSVDDYQPPQDSGLVGDAPAPLSTTSPTPDPEPVPTAPPPPPAPADQPEATTATGQSLEEQNIFAMLGVLDGSEAEREAFLDELQEVIWEDFLEKDVELLITKEEAEQLKKVQENTDKKDLELQEEIVNYLEKLIPDLEEIMLEKALELKEDMFRERITDMKAYYKEKSVALENIAKAEDLLAQDKWKDAADTLNAIR